MNHDAQRKKLPAIGRRAVFAGVRAMTLTELLSMQYNSLRREILIFILSVKEEHYRISEQAEMDKAHDAYRDAAHFHKLAALARAERESL